MRGQHAVHGRQFRVDDGYIQIYQGVPSKRRPKEGLFLFLDSQSGLRRDSGDSEYGRVRLKAAIEYAETRSCCIESTLKYSYMKLSSVTYIIFYSTHLQQNDWSMGW